jgi:hypothetical protein
MDRTQASRITSGLVLIAIGLLFFGEQASGAWGWDTAFGFERFWPVIFLVLGAGRFLAPRADGGWGGGVWLVFLGGLFLLHTHEVVPLRQSWPLFIVAGGLSLIVGSRPPRGRALGSGRR